MSVVRVLLSLVAIALLALAYRFISHGVASQDNMCLGLGAVAIVLAAPLLWFAFRSKRPNPD